jgi:hypothetical protein
MAVAGLSPGKSYFGGFGRQCRNLGVDLSLAVSLAKQPASTLVAALCNKLENN